MLSSRVNYDQAVLSSAHLMLSDSTNRYSVTFFPSAASVAWLSNDQNPAAPNGLCLQPGMSPVYLCVEDHGDCVQRAWYVVYAGALSPVSWIESLYCREKHAEAARLIANRNG